MQKITPIRITRSASNSTCTGFIYALAHIFRGIGGIALTALVNLI